MSVTKNVVAIVFRMRRLNNQQPPVAINNNCAALGLDGVWVSYRRMSKGSRLLITVFMIWLMQAVPKWAVVVFADGEVSTRIMEVFITPRAESSSQLDDSDHSYAFV